MEKMEKKMTKKTKKMSSFSPCCFFLTMDDVIAPHLIALTENLEKRRKKSELEMNFDQISEMNLMLCHRR